MTDTTPQTETGLTRREVLKRGAALGGALAWGTPLVQVIGISPAMAANTSPVCENYYCLKAEVSGNNLGPFGPLGGGQGKGKGNCINEVDVVEQGKDCDTNVPPGILEFLNENVSGNPEDGFTVLIPPSCRLVETGGSEDPFTGSVAAAAKCGRGRGGHRAPDPCFAAEVSPNGRELHFECGNDTSVSHIELILCCPE